MNDLLIYIRYKNKLWGKYININFEDIERIANIALKDFKEKKIYIYK